MAQLPRPADSVSRDVSTGLDRGGRAGHERVGVGWQRGPAAAGTRVLAGSDAIGGAGGGGVARRCAVHMLPESIAVIGNDLSVYTWVAAGMFSFHVLEQFLYWHHCHCPISEHRPSAT